jgi:hypothetical protein
VHNQPPTVAGLGIVYKRRQRWLVSDTHELLSFGGGDPPDDKIEDIIDFVRQALFLFVETPTEIARFYGGIVNRREFSTT